MAVALPFAALPLLAAPLVRSGGVLHLAAAGIAMLGAARHVGP